MHLLAENKKNLKCVVDKVRAKMSQRGKRQSRLDNDEPPPTKKRKGRPPANKSNLANVGIGNSVNPTTIESKYQNKCTYVLYDPYQLFGIFSTRKSQMRQY